MSCITVSVKAIVQYNVCLRKFAEYVELSLSYTYKIGAWSADCTHVLCMHACIHTWCRTCQVIRTDSTIFFTAVVLYLVSHDEKPYLTLSQFWVHLLEG